MNENKSGQLKVHMQVFKRNKNEKEMPRVLDLEVEATFTQHQVPTVQRDKLYLLVSSNATITLDKDLFLSPFQLRSHQYLESSSLLPLAPPSSVFSCLEAFYEDRILLQMLTLDNTFIK
jgi:hypothetical protein